MKVCRYSLMPITNKMIHKYFVSVFVGGKCASLFWSDDLCELHVCRLLYKGCEIDVFDLHSMCYVSPRFIAASEHHAKQRIKADLMPQHVVCVETKEIYASMSDCAWKIGVPPQSLASSIMELAAIGGRHYIYESDIENSEII